MSLARFLGDEDLIFRMRTHMMLRGGGRGAADCMKKPQRRWMAGRRLWGGYPLLDRLAVSGRDGTRTYLPSTNVPFSHPTELYSQ